MIKKLVENLSVHDYADVGDIIGELLQARFGVQEISFGSLDKDTEYIVGTINIVKLGDKPMTLKHKRKSVWSDDIEVTESYEWASYYELAAIKNLCDNELEGTWSDTYNFRKMLESQ